MIKVELHCHLDGSLNPVSVQEMLAEQGIHIELEELKKKLEVPEECTSLTEYLERFDLPLKCMQTKEGLKRTASELLRDVAKENVKYIEVRFAPMASVNENLTCEEVIASVVEGLKEGEKEYGVFAQLIVCAMRHHSLEMNIEMMHVARKFLGNGVCCLDLAGDESAFPTKNFRPLFAEAKACGMPFIIHSGECGSLENVREAIELGAKRMGHGIALIQDEELQAICSERRIGVEMCPISNLQTKAVESFNVYPMEEFLKKGIAVSINTDNRTVSATSMTREFEVIVNELGLTEEHILQCTKNAIETSFASDEVKKQLYKMLG